jgi:F-type H+-transporting ATPase subunit delta
MSSLATLARPYAKAAFELARDEQALAPWDDMLTLASEMAAEESMAVLLESPHISNEEVVKIITDTAGEAFYGRFRDFLSVLGGNGRLPLLPQVSSLFRELREEAEKRMSVKVVSAVPLDEDQAGRLKEALSRRMECEIELDNEIDKNVIGGAVVYAGDQVIDGSLRGKLEKLSASLAN